ncbi:carbamoyltransferase family protein [Actinosynnema mirum]|uniref:Carbamoyltransferase n=1 Tax=Actinosynnema mirum (strain ATCC 29888 / DSM 43827 / JCM 3225 / NBRC 14064 / NCIMB 13271 / NRRL B-12336 / IMRU 3971 / 101) TaxID=446462 RepID=C6WEK2_ACTMD|nr:carbamoyltransferase C-terminal domain-containing protein [Actinosynnema mirum]ACU37802.1 Carbamoyltransferase [Actinosynnema mirum DSM 43827]
MLVLGMNLSHDRSACLIRDGEVVVAIEEERLDRMKHSEGFLVHGYFEKLTKTLPMRSVTYCLDAAGVGIDEVDLVVGNRPLHDGAVRRLLRELPLRDKGKLRELPQPSHHLAHAWCAYATAPFDDTAILVVDGIGSRLPGTGRLEKHSFFHARDGRVTPVAGTSYDADFSTVGLGLFYEFFTAKLGFVTRWGHPGFGVFGCGGYLEAGKTMGLAPFGRPRPDWGPLLEYDGDDVTARMSTLEESYAKWLEAEGEEFSAAGREAWRTPFAEDVARKAQDELEEAMTHLARRARELTGASRLCLTGGVALNSVANQRISAEGLFEQVHVSPPAGDAGIAIGAAAYGYHELLGGRRRGRFTTAGVGRHYTEQDVDRALAGVGDRVRSRRADVREVARLLADRRIVGWFHGGSEIGPRALGHRSLLADPRHPGMLDYLNTVVKHREPFRPYAPSVLAEHAGSWFDLRGDSPYMLLVPEVLPARRALVPAITHVDGTARVQTVERSVNPLFHEVIQEFHALTGVPLLLNTSFNDAGEPIVETPEDALRTFLRTEIDHLYLGGRLVDKPGRALPTGHPATTEATA